MNEFDKIKLANLNDYFSLLARIENPSINYIKRASRRFGFSFDEINQFLVELKLIKIDGQLISLTNKTNNFIDDGRLKKKKLKETLVELLTKSDNKYKRLVIDYISLFNNIDDSLVHFPGLDDRIRYSSLRNLLIQIDLVKHDGLNNNYSINKVYFDQIVDITASRKKLSLKRFKQIQKSKEIIGNNAELAVIKYEKERLKNFPKYVKKIDHIAKENVAAGDDIISFEGAGNDNGVLKKRYIEVKASSRDVVHFYWSKNEMDTAKKLKNSYYLYILPVINQNNFDFENIIIIRNPALKLLNKSKEWDSEVESLSFYKK